MTEAVNNPQPIVPKPGTTDIDAGDALSRPVWGERVDPSGLPELFKGEGAPERHVRYKVPEPAIDNMHLRAVDTFFLPGRGLFTVPLAGYFQVTRGEPSSYDWDEVDMVVNYTDLKLFGNDDDLGSVTVDLNPNVLSGGEIYHTEATVTKCRIAVGAQFHLHDVGVTVFNKEPILLKNPEMKGIPTVGEGGPAAVHDLPLYNVDDPDGRPLAYLTDLQYTVLNYMNRDEALRYRQSSSEREFRQLEGEAR